MCATGSVSRVTISNAESEAKLPLLRSSSISIKSEIICTVGALTRQERKRLRRMLQLISGILCDICIFAMAREVEVRESSGSLGQRFA